MLLSGKLGGHLGLRAKGGIKITKEGCKTLRKYPKRGTKLINEVVIQNKQGIIFSWEKFPVKRFQVIIFLY